MDIFQTLKNEHDEVRETIEAAMGTGDAAVKSREGLAAKLKELLIPHAKAEQETLYARLKESEEASEMVSEAIEEHGEVENLLEDLENLEVTSEEWVDTLEQLRANIDHHVQEEESELFAQAKKQFTDEQLEDIKINYTNKKEEVVQKVNV